MVVIPPEVRRHAEERARYLVGAYADDIDEHTREAFINDVTLEMLNICSSMLRAFDAVQAANAGVVVGGASNRHARRALQKELKRRAAGA